MMLNNSVNLIPALLVGLAIFTLSGWGGGSTSDSVNESSDVPLTGFKLVWSEQFDGNSLDTSKWNIEAGYGPNHSGWVMM